MYNKLSEFVNYLYGNTSHIIENREIDVLTKLLEKQKLTEISSIPLNYYKGFQLILLMRNPSSLTYYYRAQTPRLRR